jgi:hypothetical protein
MLRKVSSAVGASETPLLGRCGETEALSVRFRVIIKMVGMSSAVQTGNLSFEEASVADIHARMKGTTTGAAARGYSRLTESPRRTLPPCTTDA